jgi:hypothetical protein
MYIPLFNLTRILGTLFSAAVTSQFVDPQAGTFEVQLQPKVESQLMIFALSPIL